MEKRGPGRLFMGWVSSREKKNLLHKSPAKNKIGQPEMPLMYRIKGSAEHADFSPFIHNEKRGADLSGPNLP